MEIPSGEHTVEFRNEAPTFHKWEKVEMIASAVLVLLIVGLLLLRYRKEAK